MLYYSFLFSVKSWIFGGAKEVKHLEPCDFYNFVLSFGHLEAHDVTSENRVGGTFRRPRSELCISKGCGTPTCAAT